VKPQVSLWKKLLQEQGELFLTLWVKPGRSTTEIRDVREENIDGTLTKVVKLDVAAQPERGKANAEIVRYFKTLVGKEVSATIIAGKHTPKKLMKLSLD